MDSSTNLQFNTLFISDKYTTGLATSLVLGMEDRNGRGFFQDEQPLCQMIFDHETGANRLPAWNEPSMSRKAPVSIIICLWYEDWQPVNKMWGMCVCLRSPDRSTCSQWCAGRLDGQKLTETWWAAGHLWPVDQLNPVWDGDLEVLRSKEASKRTVCV